MPVRRPLPNDGDAPRGEAALRLKLIVAYDGAGFSGWQCQANGDTIQDRLETAFTKIVGRKIRVHGAGRTDAGVHALGQCAHVDLAATRLAPLVLLAALNAALPPQIRVLRCRSVPRTFHARFSARGKVYRYRISTAPVLPPFEVGRAWHVTAPLDRRSLGECAAEFVGQHDFALFAANRGKLVPTTIRTIREVRVRTTSSLMTIDFDGNGFLYKMARLMVGAIVRCGLGKLTPAEVRAQLRGAMGEKSRLVAPAEGLILVRVRY
jgi:tRNA pseudouridine38-40 synthase